MSGIVVEQPYLPRYTVTWGVETVSHYLDPIYVNGISLNVSIKANNVATRNLSAQRVQAIK